MWRSDRHSIVGVFTAVLVLTVSAAAASANPKERIDYWRKNYAPLSTEDPRAARAHAIFQRVLHAAGKKGGGPQLFITASDPFGISLPIAIPDGWIILSKGVLEICYREPARGDDRLAFVLAHEIAHHLKDDFWHMKFFQALETSKAKAPQSNKDLEEEIARLVQSTESVPGKELQADQHGIVYASMAGFNTNAIVTEDDTVNFFQDWVRALDPSRLRSGSPGRSHPDPQQRATAIKVQLRQILAKMDVFQVGLQFYQAGQYPKAILAFEEFLHFFPSREVYHNLAASHHQLALQYYRLWKPEAQPLPFQLSLGVDPVARASLIALRGRDRRDKQPVELFHDHLDKALELYQTAIALDPSYVLSYNNLGCALLLKEEVYKAIATLQDALKLAPDSPQVLNNLGVAFFAVENPRQAQAHLAKARELAPAYNAPVFNLGKMAHEAQQAAEAQRYWTAYVQMDPGSPWTELLRQRISLPAAPHGPSSAIPAAEEVMGVAVAAFADEVPASWGKPETTQVDVETDPFKVARYPNAVVTLSQNEEVRMIMVLEGYKGTSARGVTIGSGEHDVRAHYGSPSQRLEMTQGASWVYEAQGIAFQLRDRQVISWLLF